jgi:hypothetical protein
MSLGRKSVTLTLLGLCFGAIAAWSIFQAQAAPRHPLDQITPEGAMLYIEAKDFSALLKDWNTSAEHAQWLKSDNYRVFSNSRLFLRLGQASDQFAAAVGIPPDMKFLTEAAGSESAVAVYDIGNLEFLYISRISSGNFLQSQLWQSRNKLQTRNAAGKPFFARKDEQSGRVVAFAVADDYLILGTREDLVAGALELISGSKGRNLGQEGWYKQTVAAASSKPGDLRMVMNLERISVTPHFRTYWVLQNITEMQSYASAISDLYREGAIYREERVIIPKKQPDEALLAQSTETVSSLLSSVPADYGFYQAGATDASRCLAILQQKILAPHFSAAAEEKQSPQVHLTSGETGAATDLETRIDVAPASHDHGTKPEDILLHELERASPQALLTIQSTRKNSDGVLLSMPTVIAISAADDWAVLPLQTAAQGVIAPGMTASNLGLEWREVKDSGGYLELDGLNPVQLAIRGKTAYFSNDVALLTSVLSAKGQPLSQPVIYAAAFRHARERQNFYKLSALLDQNARGVDNSPQFFSQNITSFSRSFSRLESEEVTVHQTKDKIQQTVTYRWMP